MKLRRRIFFPFVIAVVSALLLSVVFYWYGTRAVADSVRARVQHETSITEYLITKAEKRKHDDLISLSRSFVIREFLKQVPDKKTGEKETVLGDLSSRFKGVSKEMIFSAKEELDAFVSGDNFQEVRIINRNGETLLRSSGGKTKNNGAVVNADENAIDEKVWSVSNHKPLQPMIVKNSFGVLLRFTVPIFAAGENTNSSPKGALTADLKLDSLLKEMPEFQSGDGFILIADKTGLILYHSNMSFRFQPVNNVMSASFVNISEAMMRGENGLQSYSINGASWLVSYKQIEGTELRVAAGENYSAALQGWRTIAIAGFMLVFILSAVAIWILWRVVGKHTRNLDKVSVETAAIAEGNLNQPLTAVSSDDLRPFEGHLNIINERFREQVRREEESRQFQSFLRVSAVLAHDLKNSIAALSLLVKNMHKHFHDENFRDDAMMALQSTTDKLQGMVDKINRPSLSHSVEFRLPKQNDVVPAINRAVSATAKQSSEHEVEMYLPEKLIMYADTDRVERVIENLVLNAIESMGDDKGRITITADKINNEESFFSVSDTGAGMSKDFIKEKLFRPFSSTKRKGLGIGLYSCHEIVTALNGRIEVESEINVGTTFKVVLPSNPPC